MRPRNPALRPLVEEWKSKLMYTSELKELLDAGELTPQGAHFIAVQCKQLLARCEAIENTVYAVQNVDKERDGRLVVSVYAEYPELLARVGKINELAAMVQLTNSFIYIVVEAGQIDIELALHERHAVITQELEYQYATLCQEIDAIRYREEFENESWRGDSADDGIDCDLLDDDSDEDNLEADDDE